VDSCTPQPHGSRLAWVEGTTVYVGDARGENRVALGAGCCPLWAPDGSRVAFSSGAGVGLARADGSGVSVAGAAGATELVWSPDATLLAFRAPLDGRPQLWTVRADGAEAHAVTHVRGGLADVGFGPFSAH